MWRLLPVLAGVLACSADDRAPPPRFLGAGASSPHRGGELHIAFNDDVRTVDPGTALDTFSTMVTNHLYDTLLAFAPAASDHPLALEPELAESWSVSEDGRAYSFTLRPGLAFADGEPIVAGDFVYALERVLDPATQSGGAQYYAVIEGAPAFAEGKAPHVSGLRAPDDAHLEIRLQRPDTIFPMLLALDLAAPMKRAWVERVKERIVDTPLACGPFVLARWDRGVRLVLARNPRYWNPELPHVDALVIDLLVPRDIETLKFLSGELDAADRLSADDYLRFDNSPDWKAFLMPTQPLVAYGEVMNLRRKPFDDKRVRQAMNYAVDKRDTVSLNNGRAVIAHGVLPVLMPGYDPDLAGYPYHPEKARQLLAEAGYPDGFDVSYTTTNDEMAVRVAQSMQADLAKIGVRMSIEILTFPAYLSAVGRGQLQLAFIGWSANYPDPWDFLASLFATGSIENGTNLGGYSNPEFDRLVDDARYQLDAPRRLAMYRRAERILVDDCPWIWHYHPIEVELVQPYLKGYRPHPIWLRDYRRAWLDAPRRQRW